MSWQEQLDREVGEPRIGVVVVNYGEPGLLERNLAGLGQSEVVVVVDNLSNDRNRGRARAVAQAHGWPFVPNRNNGFGGGMNLGVGRALDEGCDVVVLVNPDLNIDPVQVRGLANAALREPMVIVAPVVLDRSGAVWGHLGYVDLDGGRLRNQGFAEDNPRWLSGACLALSADTWTALGGFSEDYFMYWEDVDLCVRLQERGGVLRQMDDVRVAHQVGGTQGDGRSRLYYFYNCRNRLLFAARHLNRSQRRRWLAATFSDVRRVARRDGSLSRLQRAWYALPACLFGAVAGVGWMLKAAIGRVG